ncbi:MAG: acetolactate synthase-1/2/3 large subunit [Paracoccaceae bacterium]|jgi:acetolactate synthase-1/2/3 large subunit
MSDSTNPSRHGGQILATQLHLLGADTVFCVPGESYLGLLDGLYEHRDSMRVISCRHESGAANMADAYAKMTGKPGICAVTRGPGATNASNGVHTAFQDSTPMILLVGQVGRSMVDREAFQEIDYRRMFGQMAKWVAQIDDISRIPEYISRAWKICQSGRPGPVVLALPEDVMSGFANVADLRPTPPTSSAPTADAMTSLSEMMAQAKKPLLVVGGPSWSADCAQLAADFATKSGLPIATAFRFQDYVDNTHDNYVGVIGIAPVAGLKQRIRDEVDLLIVLGPRMGEMTSQGYSLIDIPNPQMKMVHIHPAPDEHGHVYAPDLAITSSPQEFLKPALNLPEGTGKTRWATWRQDQHADYLAFLEPTDVPGPLNMSHVMRHMSNTLPDDAVMTNGAGNYAVWLHRFHQHRSYRTQLAPTSGSMGYGVPAAIAAKLTMPDRVVVSVAGDGCFLMTAQEMATAQQYGAPVIYLVVNNNMFGTIRMHQERNYPARVVGTELVNPDFVTYAAAFGIPGEKVTKTEEFAAAFTRARASADGYLIELQVDPEALTPVQTLSDVRAQGLADKS